MELAEALDELLADAANRLAALLEAKKKAKKKKRGNKAGTYYYEEIEVKRWLLGPGGVAGNCEECQENADTGWIEESEFFPADGQFGYVDEPPLHQNCLCDIEYRDTRRRVYV